MWFVHIRSFTTKQHWKSAFRSRVLAAGTSLETQQIWKFYFRHLSPAVLNDFSTTLCLSVLWLRSGMACGVRTVGPGPAMSCQHNLPCIIEIREVRLDKCKLPKQSVCERLDTVVFTQSPNERRSFIRFAFCPAYKTQARQDKHVTESPLAVVVSFRASLKPKTTLYVYSGFRSLFTRLYFILVHK